VFINLNGKITRTDLANISPNNRSFRYGDGCFETMKIINGTILLQHLHFDRLFNSLSILKFKIPGFFTTGYLEQQVCDLLNENKHSAFARVRLTVYRGEAPIRQIDESLNFVIQSWTGDPATNVFNKKGLHVGIYADVRKTGDLISAIKSNNYLPYIMASIASNERSLDDCIICNAFGRIAEATIANVFIVENGLLKTPPLSEGCVGGVMRRYLIDCFRRESLPFVESPLTVDELLNASEVFLTNAIVGVRWVESIEQNNYVNSTSSLLHKKFIVPLLAQTF
jgi:branched-subunit amino acid aminotransferase/4-amino-4-deoxychorismate lyase